jgi:sugar lactone lactonase YvrE
VPELAVPGLKFPEGPRWRDGTWWLSDQLGDRVLRIDEAGDFAVIAELESPSGLGFSPDGALLAARMNDPSVVRIEGDTVTEVVDLRGIARHLNDMFVGPDGRMYVDAYDDHFDRSTHRLLLVTTAGAAPVVVADAIEYPNGVAITPDGATLILSETFGTMLTAFDVATDGTLSGRRVWASLPTHTNPDGLCIDEAGDVWVASYLAGEFLHVREGGEVLQRARFDGRWALSCSLGGADGRSLLCCTSETSQDDYFERRGIGHLDVLRVDVPGVQRP